MQKKIQTLEVSVEYWNNWVQKSATYTEGLYSYLQVYWQASSQQT